MDDLTGISGTGTDHLSLVLAVGEIGIWELDVNTGAAWRNLRHDQIFGYAELLPEWTYERFLSHVVDADRERIDALYASAMKNDEKWSFECRILRADGQECWINANGQPLKDSAGRVRKLIGHVVDITHTKRNEERLRLLTSELNHRVRNMLAVLGSIVKHTAKDTPSVADMEAALLGRLAALARTHDLFVDLSGSHILVADILRTELAPYDVAAGRVAMSGDQDLSLAGKTAESFILIVHELITNAIKHGALSNETGRIDVTATHLPDSAARLVWRESGGPAVAPPDRSGFGSTLLRTALGEDGAVSLDYRANGLVCTIEFNSAPRQPAPAAPPQKAAAVERTDPPGKRCMIGED